MSTLSVSVYPVLPSEMKPSPLFPEKQGTLFSYRVRVRKTNRTRTRTQSPFPVARLFGPAIFEASKLKVLFLGVDERKHPGKLPRTYTLTHSDVTSKLTLAISQTINNSQLQGWYNRLQRDEVVAEWKKVKGRMSLHVHCHISGGHVLLDIFARLRYFIFSKELPVVLRAFVHGDGYLLNQYPELQEALVWVYFHSNNEEFNKVECWGSLKVAGTHKPGETRDDELGLGEMEDLSNMWVLPEPCQVDCECCFPPGTGPIPQRRPEKDGDRGFGLTSAANLAD